MSGASADPTMRGRVEAMVRQRQDALCAALAALDGSNFRRDPWHRSGGGGGVSRVLEGGAVFEKAGVNVAVVEGEIPRAATRSMGGGQRLADATGAGGAEALEFFAAGLSVVIHPVNPMAPTAHMNYRYFELGPPGAVEAWWFGGGADLTPSYLFEEDAAHFHRVHREVCDCFDPEYYQRFKRWCDDYFNIVHRGERRGVGGIFFDDLHQGEPAQLLAFCTACAEAFAPAYLPIVERRKEMPFGEEQRRWQQLRRGRYVEFNLVYDRGTTFGLKSGGRTESILMSLPRSARWEYDHQPAPHSPEAELLQVLRHPRDWA
jgi:coproporphyrinogen III oxidase